jgi:hypothetical protein
MSVIDEIAAERNRAMKNWDLGDWMLNVWLVIAMPYYAWILFLTVKEMLKW